METQIATISQGQFKKQQNYSVSIYMANKILDKQFIAKKVKATGIIIFF